MCGLVRYVPKINIKTCTQSVAEERETRWTQVYTYLTLSTVYNYDLVLMNVDWNLERLDTDYFLIAESQHIPPSMYAFSCYFLFVSLTII